MARYKQLMVSDGVGWYLMNPSNAWEALRVAWLLWRYPERVGILTGLKKEYTLAHWNPVESPSTENNNVRMCQCGVKPASECPEPWEPGCDLGCNPEFVRRVPMWRDPGVRADAADVLRTVLKCAAVCLLAYIGTELLKTWAGA